MKGKNFSCNNTGKRNKSDFYQTPYSITQQIIDVEPLIGKILEPACGRGAIVKVLNKNGYFPFYYDIEKDFLKETEHYGTIITNPPYSLAQKFILKAKQIATNKIIMLLPLSYLHGKKRLDTIYKDDSFRLKCVYVFCRYPLLEAEIKQNGKYNTGMMVYAWFVWDKDYNNEPVIRWLDNDMFVIRNSEVEKGGE